MIYKVQKQSTLKGIGIGYIIQCNYDESVGYIYGAVNRENKEQLTADSTVKLFYFKKDKTVAYPPFTIVSYLRERESCSYIDRTIEVTNVINLADFAIYHTNEDKNEQLRADDRYHLDLEWKLIENAKPYTEIDNDDVCICHPLIDEQRKTVEYYKFCAFDCLKLKFSLQTILECFYFTKENKRYERPISMDYVSQNLERIKKYVESFSIDNEATTFNVGEFGTFQSRPGRDDHFYFGKYQRTSTSDPYIKQLIPLSEKLDYYVLNGRGADDQDYDVIDEKETTILQNKIKEMYNKNAHYSFLVQLFLSSTKQKADSYEQANKNLFKFIDKNDAELFLLGKMDLSIDYIYNFNKQYHRVSLY